jgi:hypothetical protein
MSAWKHILLLAGALGVLGVFAPMLEVRQGRVAIELSARQLSFGFERSHSLLERELPKLAEKYLPRSARSTHQDARLVADASRWAALAYAPSALMLLLGLVGILRQRFGRVLGTLALLSSLASIASWLGLRIGLRIALQESGLEHTQVSLLFGAHLLLLAGIPGALASLGALLRPDLGRPPPPPPPGRPAHLVDSPTRARP